MFFWIYNACFPFVFLALLPGYLWRMRRRGDFRARFGQRLGWYSRAEQARFAAGPPRLWLQAVSVGEMLTALKFIAALREQVPGLPLILSTTTTTGFRLAEARAGRDVEVVYTPIDLLPIVRRTFRTLRPAAVVIVDGGLWPNQLWEARRRKLPTALVNARLSPRSEGRFRRFPRLSTTIFGLLDLVCVSEPTDVSRWATLGVARGRIRHTGSIKYDDESPTQPADPMDDGTMPEDRAAAVRTLLAGIGIAPDRPVLLAGSTHAGEELLLAETYLALRATCPALVLILAPRHVERTGAIIEALRPLGVGIRRRTRLTAAASEAPLAATAPPPEILILDTTGELPEWYAVATVVFVGKSLTAVGGQNPAEAISNGKPVIVGPHMENFDDLTRALLAADAIRQVQDAAGLLAACRQLLEDPRQRNRMAGAARQQLTAHRGAARRSAAALLEQVKISAC